MISALYMVEPKLKFALAKNVQEDIKISLIAVVYIKPTQYGGLCVQQKGVVKLNIKYT